MYPQDWPAPPYSSYPEGELGSPAEITIPKTRDRYWLNLLLFVLTLLSTTIVGAAIQYDFQRNVPLDVERTFDAFGWLWSNPRALLSGVPFSLTLITILLAHELGHYLACVYYRLDASLPYFLPAPTLTGTFGAFIRIRSPIYSKRILFDIGIAGPLAGFVFLLPALGVGVALSKIIPGIGHQGAIQFGAPPLLWLVQKAIFPGVPAADIYLHPVARAAWIGILATALNLLPIGQLDGGHVLYAMMGEKHRLVSRIFILLLIPLGIFFWWVWLLWAVVLFFLGRRHPMIYDDADIGPARTRLGYIALAIFLLCFTFAPISTGGL